MMRKKRKSSLLLLGSVLTAVGMLFFAYTITNLGVALGEEVELIKKANAAKRLFRLDKEEPVPDSLLFVSVSYDKKLVSVDDKDGFPIGNIDITDRSKLYELLAQLRRADNYKYIFLDVFFNKKYSSEDDDKLYQLIGSMPRLVIPRHHDADLADEKKIGKKAFYSDYLHTFFSEFFFKYQLINGNDTSAMLKIYSDETGHTIKQYGPLYFDGGRICNKTLFAYHTVKFEGQYDEDGNMNFYRMGADLLSDTTQLSILAKGKYIFIGDLELNDIHETVQGNIPGPVICANEFLATMNGQHKVPVMVAVLLFVVFFGFSYAIYSGRSMMYLITSGLKRWPSVASNKGLVLVLSFFGYSTILTVLCLVFYYVLHTSYDIFITALAFQIIEYIVNKCRKTTTN